MKKQFSVVFTSVMIVIFLLTGCKPTTDNLINAIKKDDFTKVENIAKQVDVNEKNEEGIIPLLLAVEKGNIDIV